MHMEHTKDSPRSPVSQSESAFLILGSHRTDRRQRIDGQPVIPPQTNNSYSKDRLVIFSHRFCCVCNGLLCPQSVTECFLISELQLKCHIFRNGVWPLYWSWTCHSHMASECFPPQLIRACVYIFVPRLVCRPHETVLMLIILTTVSPGLSRNLNSFEYGNHLDADSITVPTYGNQTLEPRQSCLYGAQHTKVCMHGCKYH